MAIRRMPGRALCGLVAASFLLTSMPLPEGRAQPAPAGSEAVAAAACDLTGQWRSSRGPMQLVHATQPAVPGALVDGSAAPALEPAATGIAGSVRTAAGEIRLDGSVAAGRVELRWYAPTADGEATPRDGWFEIGADCATLTGSFRDDGGEQPWVAQRIVAAAEGDDAAAVVELAAKLARVDEGMGAIQALRDSLPRGEIDVAARASALPASVEAIYAHVRESIAFEAYQGVLRGARGALVSSAGNAADRSLLLAALLTEHGFEIRFVTGTLDEATAARLVDGMRPAAQPAVLPAPEAALEARLVTVAGSDPARMQAAAVPREAARDALLDAVAGDVAGYGEQIASLLTASGLVLPVDPAALRAELIARARPHVWIQVAQDGGWLDLDTLADAPGGTLTVVDATYDALPEEMHHLVRFRVTVERLEGGLLAEEEVAGWQIPMADLAALGFPGIWIGNVPMDAPETMAAQAGFESLGDYAAAQGPERMLAATRFQPLLALSTGERQPGTGFDLSGRTVAGDWRIAAAAAIGETYTGALTGATGALEGLFGEPAATPAAPPVMTAQWIDFELAAPGVATRSERRFVVDRLGPAARAAGVAVLPGEAPDDDALRLALAGMSEIMVTTGVVSEALAFDTMLANYARNRETLERLAAMAAGTQPLDAGFYGAYAPYPNKLMIHALLQQEQARLVAARSGVHAYSAEPSVVVRRLMVWQGEDGALGGGQAIDLVHTRLQTAAVDGIPAELVARFQRDYGTALTSLEHQMLGWIGRAECPECGDQPVVGTTAVMQQASAAGVAMRVLTSETPDAIPTAYAADDRMRIAADLAAGYWVIVPEAPVSVAGDDVVAWWRIDPATGATIGMTPHGGADFVEYVLGVILLAWPFELGWVMGFLGCTGISGGAIGGGKLFTCVLCGLITGMCLELAWLATNFIGLIAASSTCGLGAGVGAAVTCGVGGML